MKRASNELIRCIVALPSAEFALAVAGVYQSLRGRAARISHKIIRNRRWLLLYRLDHQVTAR